MHATNLPVNLSNVVAVAGGWDSREEILFHDGSLLSNYGVSNVMSVARGHFFALAITTEEGPAASAVPCSEPSWAAGRFAASVATRCGGVYAPQYKDRLTDERWTPMGLVAGTGQPRQFEDLAATVPQRFYRIIRW